MSTPDVQVGQVWADNDKRSTGRYVKVVAIIPGVPAEPHQMARPAKAEVALCTIGGQIIRVSGKETRTRIAISRMRPTSNGYRLVQAVPDRDHAGLELPCTPCAGPCRIDRPDQPAGGFRG